MLGRIVANAGQLPVAEVFAAYRQVLGALLRMPARTPSLANAAQHAFGYVSPRLTPSERRSFLARLDRYRAGKLPLAGVRTTLRQWAERFEERYLLDQTFFEPYPPMLDDPSLLGPEPAPHHGG